MFVFSDFGWFKKKIEAGNNSRDFQHTIGNCKHYGSKAADIGAGIAAIGLLLPLFIGIFNKDNDDSWKKGNNNRTKKR